MIARSCNARVISYNNMGLKSLLLTEGVIVATCFSTSAAARQLASEPSASSPSTSSSSSLLCSRALATTLWGAAFAFFSLMADAWPAYKVNASLDGQISLPEDFLIFLLCAPLLPFLGIGIIFFRMSTTLRFRQILRSSTNSELGSDIMSMSNKLWRVIEHILVILFGINQPRGFLERTRIVGSTYIVLVMSHSTKLPSTHIDTHRGLEQEENLADALILGQKVAGNSCLMVLNDAGKLALLESRILPNHKQLRFLDGRSGIAAFIIGVQAVGYATSIVYRAIGHLRISPIEAIGFSFSMLVIARSVVHAVGVIRANPVIIHLNLTEEQEMLEKCQSTRWSVADDGIRENALILGVVVVGTVVVAFTILVEWHVLKISALDAFGPNLFLLSLIIQLFSNIILMKHPEIKLWALLIPVGVMSFGGIVVSIVATILNWQTDKFDS